MNRLQNRLLASLFALACLPAFAQTLATVNGKPIPAAQADALVQQLAARGQPDSPQLRAMVKDELVTREILLQEANRKKLGNTPAVKEQVELARQDILINALQADFVQKNPVSEAEIKAEYDRAKQAIGDKEYHARHILVPGEDEAKAIIAKLNGGASFEELAKQQSKDEGSASKGGDLDWSSPAKFVKPFADALASLQKGQVTQTPVKSQFGYHVIKVEDVRPLQFPTLEEIKPRIERNLQMKKLQAYQEELRAKAKVK